MTILPESLATTWHTVNGRNINEAVFFSLLAGEIEHQADNPPVQKEK